MPRPSNVEANNLGLLNVYFELATLNREMQPTTTPTSYRTSCASSLCFIDADVSPTQMMNATIKMQGRYSLIYTASKWRVDCIFNATCRFPVTSAFDRHAGTLHYPPRLHALSNIIAAPNDFVVVVTG
jgi:hypothetical protein